ncbi:MAG: hypothetical protein VCA74_03800 [Deltaproteobacteria bacterium]
MATKLSVVARPVAVSRAVRVPQQRHAHQAVMKTVQTPARAEGRRTAKAPGPKVLIEAAANQ